MASVLGFDTYIRVSDTGGREGDSYQTVREQRRTNTQTAQRKNVPLSGFEILEEDVSGNKAAKERGLEQILKRIESGQSRGLIVAYQDRLSRGSLIEQASIWERLEKAGARLITGDGLDSADEGQELLFTIRAGIARDQWRRKRADWQKSKRNAIERGIHFASKVPTGYTRTKGKKLEVDPPMAEVVRGVFERRANGWSRGRIARWMNEQDCTNGVATQETVRSIIKGRTCLGDAYSGEFVKRNAHPAIVSQKLWDEANAVEGKGNRGTGKVARTMLALGLATCANCGRKLQVNMGGSGDKRYPYYACKHMHCKAHASIKATDLDIYIQTWILTIPTEVSVIKIEAKSDIAEARKALEEAEYDKRLFVANRKLRRILSAEEYAEELEDLVETVTEAQIRLDMAEKEEQDAKLLTALDLWSEWDIDTKREYLQKVVSSLTIGQSKRGKVPVYDRIHVEFAVPIERPQRLLNEIT
jgi:Resolvase, N terminal domain/Recombinase/Recombinase zinc beta ribbon domain